MEIIVAEFISIFNDSKLGIVFLKKEFIQITAGL